MRTDPKSDSTPTDRETGRTLLLGTILMAAVAVWALPPDARFGLGVGVILGAVAMFAVWMCEGAGRDTSASHESR